LCGKRLVLFFCLLSSVLCLGVSQVTPSIATSPQDQSKALVTQLEEARSIVLSLRQSQDSRDTLMRQRELRLSESEEASKQRESQLSSRETALDQREQILSGREQSLARSTVTLDDLKTSLEVASKQLAQLSPRIDRYSVKIALFEALAMASTTALVSSLVASSTGLKTLPTVATGFALGATGGIALGLAGIHSRSSITLP
jgi:hypothetical protein